MTDDETVELIVSEFGFSTEKIEIAHKIPTYEISRHNRLRKTGEINGLRNTSGHRSGISSRSSQATRGT